MSLADMFRANNMPVEQQVARIQAPQMPAVDMSQFFSMMPARPQASAIPEGFRSAAGQPIEREFHSGSFGGAFGSTDNPIQNAATLVDAYRTTHPDGTLQSIHNPGMFYQPGAANYPGAAASAPVQQPAAKFPSQSQMMARQMNSQAAGLSGGK